MLHCTRKLVSRVLRDGSQLRGFLKQNPTADVIVIVERWNTAPELKAAVLGLRFKTTCVLQLRELKHVLVMRVPGMSVLVWGDARQLPGCGSSWP